MFRILSRIFSKTIFFKTFQASQSKFFDPFWGGVTPYIFNTNGLK